mmetsp:Transcript_8238/g.15403  ORF Transcript_8238/g.15403 Transcript_8238/m.15403 type:complete len:244 (+) Transcript_8238:2072-2803(+)
MKSVHFFMTTLASSPASSTTFNVALISSMLRSLPVVKGSASSCNVLAAFSASSTRVSRSLRRESARSCATFHCFSSSFFCSSIFLCCSLMSWMRCMAWLTPCSASCSILSRWVPQLSSSIRRISASSWRNTSSVSTVAERTFWMTLRIARVARCSSRFCAMSASRRACSSIRLRFASSSCRRFSSSCWRCNSCALIPEFHCGCCCCCCICPWYSGCCCCCCCCCCWPYCCCWYGCAREDHCCC